MKINISKKVGIFVGVLSLGISGFAFHFAKAWSEPSVAPPASNVGAPITANGTLQVKAGSLGVGASMSVLGGFAAGASDSINLYRSADNHLTIQTTLDGQPLGTYGGDSENRLLLQPLVGNVGIGTASPGYKLDVNGVTNTSAIVTGGGSSSNWATLNVGGTYGLNVAGSIYSYNSMCVGNNSGYCDSNGGVVIGKVNSNAGANITTGTSYVSGPFGIGTASPAYPLHLNNAGGETGILTTYAGNNIYLSHGGWGMGAGMFGIGNGSWPALKINAGNGDISTAGGVYANNGNASLYWSGGEGETLKLNGNNGVSVFAENLNGNFRLVNSPWSAELFRVDQSGNGSFAGAAYANANGLGMSPLCQANGQNCPTNNDLKLDAWQGNHYSGSDGSEYATIFRDTNDGAYYLDPNGISNLNNVTAGSGANGNWAALNAGGPYSINAKGSIYSYDSMCVGNNSGSCDSSGGVVIGKANTSATTNITTGNSFFNGNVGIGTTSPGAKLDVRGDELVSGTFYAPYSNSSVMSTGTAFAGIYYDSNNGNYYTQPSSWSRFNVIYPDGIYFSDGTFQTSAAKDEPWETVTKDFDLSASDCNGNWTSWHTRSIALPQYTISIVNNIVAGAGTFMETWGYDNGGNWSELGYTGTNCRANGTGYYCGWGNQDPGNNSVQPSLPRSSSSSITIGVGGYCYYGNGHTGRLTVTYMRPRAATFNTLANEPQ